MLPRGRLQNANYLLWDQKSNYLPEHKENNMMHNHITSTATTPTTGSDLNLEDYPTKALGKRERIGLPHTESVEHTRTTGTMARSRKTFKVAPLSNFYSQESLEMLDLERRLVQDPECKVVHLTGENQQKTISNFRGGIVEENDRFSGGLFRDAIVSLLHATNSSEPSINDFKYSLVGHLGKPLCADEPRFFKSKASLIVCHTKDDVRAMAVRIANADPKLSVVAIQDVRSLDDNTFKQIIEADAVVITTGSSYNNNSKSIFHNHLGFSVDWFPEELERLREENTRDIPEDVLDALLGSVCVNSLIFFFWRRVIFTFGHDIKIFPKRVTSNALNIWVVIGKSVKDLNHEETCQLASLISGENIIPPKKVAKPRTKHIVASAENVNEIGNYLSDQLKFVIERKKNLPVLSEPNIVQVVRSPEEELFYSQHCLSLGCDRNRFQFEEVKWTSFLNVGYVLKSESVKNDLDQRIGPLQLDRIRKKMMVFVDKCGPAMKILETLLTKASYHCREIKGEYETTLKTNYHTNQVTEMRVKFKEDNLLLVVVSRNGNEIQYDLKTGDLANSSDDKQVSSAVSLLRDSFLRKFDVLRQVISRVIAIKMPFEPTEATKTRIMRYDIMMDELLALQGGIIHSFAINVLSELKQPRYRWLFSCDPEFREHVKILESHPVESPLFLFASYQWCQSFLSKNAAQSESQKVVPRVIELLNRRKESFENSSPHVLGFFSGKNVECENGLEFCSQCKGEPALEVNILGCGHILCFECAKTNGRGTEDFFVKCSTCGIGTDRPVPFANRSQKFIKSHYDTLSEDKNNQKFLLPFCGTDNSCDFPGMSSKACAVVQLLSQPACEDTKTVIYSLRNSLSKSISGNCKKIGIEVGCFSDDKKVFRNLVDRFNNRDTIQEPPLKSRKTSKSKNKSHVPLNVLAISKGKGEVSFGLQLKNVSRIICTFNISESDLSDLLGCIDNAPHSENIKFCKVDIMGENFPVYLSAKHQFETVVEPESQEESSTDSETHQ